MINEEKLMNKKEKAVATAFFKGYTLRFEYKTDMEDEYTPRSLLTVSDIKYNDDSDILVGGCINGNGDYRRFFLDNMINIECWKIVYDI